ncbi:kinase-like protein [Pluteus cervinus]|uniref:Kinase-like protein n=1 Tax=Pluteus cervinus TaxID=181527 RepID=A0ACD2ZYK8_9AGAR|nr:kinase-like protein [Pluteus cervinus]
MALYPQCPSREELRRYPVEKVLHSGECTLIVRPEPGFVFKVQPGIEEEIHALEFIARKFGGQIPIPKLLHHPPLPLPGQRMSRSYMCMKECPGLSLDKVVDSMTLSQLDHIADQLSDVLRTMSTVCSARVGTVYGGPFRTEFFPSHMSPERAFDSTQEFLNEYRELLLHCSGEEYTQNLISSFPRDVPVCFTHGDLLPKNIMVEGSTITAIIDWSTAGFYPSFWEYCRMHDPYFMTPGWKHILSRVFPGPRRDGEIQAVRKLLDTVQYFF